MLNKEPNRLDSIVMECSTPFSLFSNVAEAYLTRTIPNTSSDAALKAALSGISPSLAVEKILDMMFEEARKMDPIDYFRI